MIIQLIDKDKMQNWPIELPLIFIEYIRSNQLDTYGSAKKEVENYLDEVMKDVAVPRLISVLEGNEDDEIISALERIEELAKKNIEMTTPIKPYLINLVDSKNKEIGNLAKNISKIFERAARNKEIAKNRKIMREKERDFLAGKINAEEYAKLRKEYLTLKG
ncbi:MAG: hypothetical protein ACTSPS_00135 [Promethearchaeota archaeon]